MSGVLPKSPGAFVNDEFSPTSFWTSARLPLKAAVWMAPFLVDPATGEEEEEEEEEEEGGG